MVTTQLSQGYPRDCSPTLENSPAFDNIKIEMKWLDEKYLCGYKLLHWFDRNFANLWISNYWRYFFQIKESILSRFVLVAGAKGFLNVDRSKSLFHDPHHEFWENLSSWKKLKFINFFIDINKKNLKKLHILFISWQISHCFMGRYNLSFS